MLCVAKWELFLKSPTTWILDSFSSRYLFHILVGGTYYLKVAYCFFVVKVLSMFLIGVCRCFYLSTSKIKLLCQGARKGRTVQGHREDAGT